MWRNPFSNPALWGAAACFAVSISAVAQVQTTTAVLVSSPQSVLICGNSIQLSATAFDTYGAAVFGFAPQWTSSNPAVASVDQNGNVQGVMPGAASIQAADPVTGTLGSFSVRVQPLRINITPARPSLRVGDAVHLSATALDANGNPLSGLNFIWTSGIPGIATVANDGTVTAVRSGAVTVSAAINAAGPPLNVAAEVQVLVMRKSDYTLTRLAGSDDAAPPLSLRVPKMISASGDNYVATIADLSSGAQGLVLAANGAPRVLGVTGQVFPGLNKVINRFTGVSVNSSGDVVAVVQFPAEWCDNALVLYHQTQPPVVLDAGCYISITDRALANNGDVIYLLESNGNHYYIHHANGSRTLLLQRGDRLSGSLTVGSLGRSMLTSTGSAILEVYPVGGSGQLWMWSGSSFQKMVGLNDSLPMGLITSYNFPVETGKGEIYTLLQAVNSPVTVVHYSGGTWTPVVQAGNAFGGTQFWWFYQISAAGADGSVAVVADSPNGSGVFRLSGGSVTLLSKVTSWGAVNQLAGGATGVFCAGLISAAAGIYELTGGLPAAVVSAGWPLPANGNLSLIWDSVPERGSATNPLMRQPGDGLVRVGSSVPQTVLSPGGAAGSDSVLSLGGVASAPDGNHVAVSAMTNAGPGLLLAHDGQVSLIGDTNSNFFKAGGQRVNWLDTGGSSPYDMNANQQFLAMVWTGGGGLWRFDQTTSQSVNVIYQGMTSAGGGAGYGWVPQAAIDPSGNVAFIASLNDGKQGLYLWTNGAVQKLLRTGDTGLLGATVTGISGVQFAGTRVIARVNYPTTTIIESYDGTKWSSLVAQGSALSFGRSIDNFMGPYTFADAAGDIVYEARTAGYPNVLVRTRDGKDRVVATAAEPLPDGSWPIFFYGFNITAQGNVLFVAETYHDGKSHMTLYSAAPVAN
jgi:hypothetical protein